MVLRTMQQIVAHRAIEIDDAAFTQNMALLRGIGHPSAPFSRTKVDAHRRPSQVHGLSTVLHVVAATNRANTGIIMIESTFAALQILEVVTIVPKICEDLCFIELDPADYGGKSMGIAILMAATSGATHGTPSISISALKVLPLPLHQHRQTAQCTLSLADGKRRQKFAAAIDSSPSMMIRLALRSTARAHDAIRVCISLLQCQGQPAMPTRFDSFHTGSCLVWPAMTAACFKS